MNPAPTAQDIASALNLSGPEALNQMRQWAEAGYADAQLVLGQMLLDGRGTAPNPQNALTWFVKAGRQGHPMAMNMVGRCYENGWGVEADQETATNWFRNAAHAGLDWGMYNYATSLALGRGVVEDRKSAFEWLTRATALGHAKAMNVLGGFYEDGWVVPVDLGQARSLYQQAAEGGDFRGWFNLGRFQWSEGLCDDARASFRNAQTGATPAFRLAMDEYLEKAGVGPVS